MSDFFDPSILDLDPFQSLIRYSSSGYGEDSHIMPLFPPPQPAQHIRIHHPFKQQQQHKDSTNHHFQPGEDSEIALPGSQLELDEPKRFTRFTNAQRKVLEFHFNNGDYWPTKRMREKLADALQVPQRKVQIWFQNQRAKHKDLLANQPCPLSPSSESEEDRAIQQDLELLKKLERKEAKSDKQKHRHSHPSSVSSYERFLLNSKTFPRQL
jgi:hypothetical protein